MSIGRAFRLAALVLGAITLVLAAIEVVVVVRTRSFLAESITAPGQVVALEPRESCSTRKDEGGEERQTCGPVYAPRVRFIAADGREVVFVSDVASNPPSYAAGDRVEVRYRPERPAQARIAAVSEMWLGAIVVGSITAVFAGLTALWAVLAARFREA